MTNQDIANQIIDVILEEERIEKERAKQGLPPLNPSLEHILWQRVLDGQILIDFNGHFGEAIGPVALADSILHKDETEPYSYLVDALFHGLNYMLHFQFSNFQSPEDSALCEAWVKGEITAPYRTKPFIRNCNVCGHLTYSTFDGQIVRIMSTGFPITDEKPTMVPDDQASCIHAGGISDHTVEIDVPSGILAFGNDFREFIPEEIEEDIGLEIGKKRYIERYAEQGMFHPFVSNTCPKIFLSDNGVITIGNNGHKNNNEDIDRGFGQKVGSVTTDLWWVSVMDYDTLIARTGDNSSIERWIDAKIEVTPGRYQMTVHTKPAMWGHWSKGECFATIKRVLAS